MGRAFNLETQAWEEHGEETPTALGLLQSVYRDVAQPLSTRPRAAIESLPYENPKLSAMAVSQVTGEEFAKALDRAIERSSKVINGKPLALPPPRLR